MGHAHILTIHEDGIRSVKQHPDDRRKYRDAIGDAVLKLCLNPDMMETPEGPQPVTSEAVLNQDGCVRHDARIHSTDEHVFIWAGNCLRTLNQLDDEQVEGAKRLFDALYEQRKHRMT